MCRKVNRASVRCTPPRRWRTSFVSPGPKSGCCSRPSPLPSGPFDPGFVFFSPLCALESLVRQYSDGTSPIPAYGCRGGVDFFFINAADGHTYPCGYRGNEDFGALWDVDPGRLMPPAEADACRQCDWECFRDPSALFGPLLEAAANPLGLIRRMATTPGALATWAGDLSYYRACGFFNGRQSPDYRKLRRF